MVRDVVDGYFAAKLDDDVTIALEVRQDTYILSLIHKCGATLASEEIKDLPTALRAMAEALDMGKKKR